MKNICSNLPSQTQRLYDLSMSGRILTLQKIQHTLAFGNHFQKASARAYVFDVLFQMLCQPLNFLGEERNLHFRRSRIALMRGGFGDHFSFLLRR